ncbi:MAG: class I SAM-dependent methyltransferase [Acidobacteriota bacterium]
MNHRLPIICPKCLSRRVETALDDSLSCSRCASRFPVVASFPILLEDEEVRAQLASETPLGDTRVAFYQNDEEYLPNTGPESLFSSALASAAGNGPVLEIGSGRGAFRNIARDYVALDLSLSALRRNLAGHVGLCATADLIPLASASCRFVFSVQTLEHIPSTDRAFEEIDRVLAPGGVAYLAPAWHCRPWVADGIPVRSYRELAWKQRVVKMSIPIRNSVVFRGVASLPWRVWRRLTQAGAGPLRFARIRPNYEHFWMSDSDACASIDSHEAILFFERRGYEILNPRGGVASRLLFRAGPVIVRKMPSNKGTRNA